MGRRATIIVLDGLGAGHAPDAAEFGDEGSNTLGNTAKAVGGLRAPNLQALGLGNIGEIEGVAPAGSPVASHGLMVELSAAKATLAGHWEMMGLVLEDPLPTYPEGFPEDILHRFEEETGRGVIGNRPASGTQIIEELGPEQERTGDWILYTSADSVFQVAANTGVIPLEELYEACEKAHEMLIGEGEIMVERVIARPFHGEPGAYERENENRHDYGITPPVGDLPGPHRGCGPRDRGRRQDPGHLRRQGHHRNTSPPRPTTTPKWTPSWRPWAASSRASSSPTSSTSTPSTATAATRKAWPRT